MADDKQGDAVPGSAVPESISLTGNDGSPDTPLSRWLLARRVAPAGPEAAEAPRGETQPWWKVMTLTGVDYFSTLSYLPAIAVLAAGALSPIATLLIVILTMFGMLPMYRRVAKESPHGQGSVAMLERLLPFWRGKLFVLILLGFVATSWIITITLSSADATVHLLENPYVPDVPARAERDRDRRAARHPRRRVPARVQRGGQRRGAARRRVPAAERRRGRRGSRGHCQRAADAERTGSIACSRSGGNFVDVARLALFAFPLLVLGLSGFETGVSMMPLIKAGGLTDSAKLRERVTNTKKLLTTAALIMSIYLLTSSVITTVLIPAEEFEEGGAANGRALAYLAHEYLGNVFGTAYDVSSILILWFAGASAMAGLINIVPRYLPAYGMAPEWSRAVRPVVLVYTGVSIIITIAFGADVNAQAGAYATGILAMMVSAAIAVTITTARRREWRATVGFGVVATVMIYALVANIVESPDGIAISGLFIAGILIISIASRVYRATELRVDTVEFNVGARRIIDEALAAGHGLHIIANRRARADGHSGSADAYAQKEASQRALNPIPGGTVLFLEVEIVDPSQFSQTLQVRGYDVEEFRVLRVESAVVPNTIAAILLALRDGTGVRPQCYFEWAEGNPIAYLFKYLLFGRGDTAPLVREILREVEKNPKLRPGIHVGG